MNRRHFYYEDLASSVFFIIVQISKHLLFIFLEHLQHIQIVKIGYFVFFPHFIVGVFGLVKSFSDFKILLQNCVTCSVICLYLLVVVNILNSKFVLDAEGRFAPVLHCKYFCEIHHVPPRYEKTEKRSCEDPSSHVEKCCEKTHTCPSDDEDVF